MRANHNILLLILINLSFTPILAQSTLLGSIWDKSQNLPLEYCSVQIYELPDTNILTGTITNSDGSFVIKYIAQGKYLMNCTYIGYDHYSQVFEVLHEKIYNFDTIILTPISQNLQEILVSSQKTYYHEQVDKTTVIPGKMDIKSSFNSIDILKKIPGVKVDIINKNIGLIDEKNVIVLINGIQREGAYNFLMQTPPEWIEKIDVISSPSSKYDSQVEGIINVIVNKKLFHGITITASPSIAIDKKQKYNDSGISFDYGVSKFRFFASYDFHLRQPDEKDQSKINLTNNELEYFSTGKYRKNKETGNFFMYGLDYFINSKNTINFTGSYEKYNIQSDVLYYNDIHVNNLISKLYTTEINNSTKLKMQNYSLFYKREFNDEGHELTFDGNIYFMKEPSNTTNNLNYYDISDPDIIISNTHRNEVENNERYSLRCNINYLIPLINSFKIESGYNFYLNDINDNYSDEIQTDKLLYNEFRNSIYSIVTKNYEKFGIQGGIRLENSNIFFDTESINKYVKLLPSIKLFKKINRNHTVRLNYYRLLNRPNYWFLNPFIRYTDSITIRQGNPDLLPVIKDIYKLEHIYRNDKNYFSSTLYYRNYSDIIQNVRTLTNDNVLSYKYKNVSQLHKIGVKFNYSVDLTETWELSPSLNLYNETYIFDNSKRNNNSYDFSLTTQFMLPYHIISFIDFTYSSWNLTAQGKSIDLPSLDIALIKRVLKDRGTIKLIYTDFPLFDYKTIDNQKNNEFFQENINTLRLSTLVFSFSYSIMKGKEYESLDRDYNMEDDYHK